MMNQEKNNDAPNADFNAPLEQLRTLLAGQNAEMQEMFAEAEQLGVPVHMQPDIHAVRASVSSEVFEQIQSIVTQTRDIDEELSARSATTGKLPHKVRNRI